MTKHTRNADLAVTLGGYLLKLREVYNCALLEEAQDYVESNVDFAALNRAIFKAKTRRTTAIVGALTNVFRLLNAVRYLQGDVQFKAYRESLSPALKLLEQKTLEQEQ